MNAILFLSFLGGLILLPLSILLLIRTAVQDRDLEPIDLWVLVFTSLFLGIPLGIKIFLL